MSEGCPMRHLSPLARPTAKPSAVGAGDCHAGPGPSPSPLRVLSGLRRKAPPASGERRGAAQRPSLDRRRKVLRARPQAGRFSGVAHRRRRRVLLGLVRRRRLAARPRRRPWSAGAPVDLLGPARHRRGRRRRGAGEDDIAMKDMNRLRR